VSTPDPIRARGPIDLPAVEAAASELLRALGYDNQEILDLFFEKNTFFLSKEYVELKLVPERLRGETGEGSKGGGGRLRLRSQSPSRKKKRNLRP
jgi:hypothetical protein